MLYTLFTLGVDSLLLICELPEKIISVLLNHTTDNTITSRYTGEIGLKKKAEKLQIIQGFILETATKNNNVVGITQDRRLEK